MLLAFVQSTFGTLPKPIDDLLIAAMVAVNTASAAVNAASAAVSPLMSEICEGT
jgi:hypothetical protein